jgi:hypothetical protein
MFDSLVPISIAEDRSSDGGQSANTCLYPLHQNGLSAVRVRRRRGFRLGRACASQALDGRRRPGSRVPRSPEGAPVWPRSVIRVDTYRPGLCMAAANSSTDVRAPGIGTVPLVRSERDCHHFPLVWLIRHTFTHCYLSIPGSHGAKLASSAEVAVPKAWQSMEGDRLNSGGAEVDPDVPSRRSL